MSVPQNPNPGERTASEAAKSHADTLVIRCPGCNKKLSARRASVGKTFACPNCKAAITVADAAQPTVNEAKRAKASHEAEPKAHESSIPPFAPPQNTTSRPHDGHLEDFDDFDDYRPTASAAPSAPLPPTPQAGTSHKPSRSSLLTRLNAISFRPNWQIPNLKLPNYLVRGRGSALEQVAECFATAIDAQKGSSVRLAFASESQNIPQQDRPLRITNALKLGHKSSTDVTLKRQGADLYVEFNAKCRTSTVYLKRLLYSIMFCTLFIGLSAAYLVYTGAFDSWLKDSALKDAQVTDKVAEFLVRKQKEGYRVFTAATFVDKLQSLKQATILSELQSQVERDEIVLSDAIPKIHALVEQLGAKVTLHGSLEQELELKIDELTKATQLSPEVSRIDAMYRSIFDDSHLDHFPNTPDRSNQSPVQSAISDHSSYSVPSTTEEILKRLQTIRDYLAAGDSWKSIDGTTAFDSDISEERKAARRKAFRDQHSHEVEALDVCITRIESLINEVKELEAKRDAHDKGARETSKENEDEFPIYGLSSEVSGYSGSLLRPNVEHKYTRPKSGFDTWLYDSLDREWQWPAKLIQDNVPKEEWLRRVGPTRAKLAELYLTAGCAEGRIASCKKLLNLNGHDLLLRLALSMQDVNANNTFQYRQNEYSVEFVPGFKRPYSPGYLPNETPRDLFTRIDKIDFLGKVDFTSYVVEDLESIAPPTMHGAVGFGCPAYDAARSNMPRLIEESLKHAITQVPPATLAGLVQQDPKLFFLNNSTAFAVIGAIVGACLWLLPPTWIDPFCRLLGWPTFDEFKKSALAHNAWVERVLSDTLLHEFGVQEGDRFTVHAN